MATAYQNIAMQALMNWNGLSYEEALEKIQTESVSELEGQVYAMGSVKYAVIGVGKVAHLSEEEVEQLFDACVNGPEDASIIQTVTEKVHGLENQQILDVLATIHDGWVQDNSSEKTFQKKVDREQLRQYAPLELIGWNEAKSDLLFLGPILDAVGVTVDEEQLQDAYHSRVSKYMEDNRLHSKDDLVHLIQTGREYYSVLPKELEERLLPLSETVASQIIHNWEVKDTKSLEQFSSNNQVTM